MSCSVYSYEIYYFLAMFNTNTCQVIATSVIKMLCPQDNLDRCWRTNIVKVNTSEMAK